ncbi:MAG: P27 family phage terminase small subunit [Bacteroidales bacterium]|nr:P27 family phage terminase small subunit [Candidatus Colicola equi]
MKMEIGKGVDKGIRKYIAVCEEKLKATFGEHDARWMLPLKILADNLEIYEDLHEKVLTVGTTYKSNGLWKVNPALDRLQAVQVRIEAAYKELGLTPYAQTKLKNTADDGQLSLYDLMGDPAPIRIAN